MCAHTSVCVVYILNAGLSIHPLRKGILILSYTKPAADCRASSFLIETWNKPTMTFISQQHLQHIQHNNSLGDKAASYLDSSMWVFTSIPVPRPRCVDSPDTSYSHKGHVCHAAVWEDSTIISTVCLQKFSSETNSGKRYQDYIKELSKTCLDLGNSPLCLHCLLSIWI